MFLALHASKICSDGANNFKIQRNYVEMDSFVLAQILLCYQLYAYKNEQHLILFFYIWLN